MSQIVFMRSKCSSEPLVVPAVTDEPTVAAAGLLSAIRLWMYWKMVSFLSVSRISSQMYSKPFSTATILLLLVAVAAAAVAVADLASTRRNSSSLVCDDAAAADCWSLLEVVASAERAPVQEL